MAMQLASRLMALPSASPVWQQAATLEPQAFWMGMATVGEIVRIEILEGRSLRSWWRLTDGDAQAVEANEVLTAVAAGNLLTVAALGGVVLAGDVDLLVAIRGTYLMLLGGAQVGKMVPDSQAAFAVRAMPMRPDGRMSRKTNHRRERRRQQRPRRRR
jgi:hypothetical protein